MRIVKSLIVIFMVFITFTSCMESQNDIVRKCQYGNIIIETDEIPVNIFLKDITVYRNGNIRGIRIPDERIVILKLREYENLNTYLCEYP